MKEFLIEVEIFKSDDGDDELDVVEEVLDDVDDIWDLNDKNKKAAAMIYYPLLMIFLMR